MKKLIFSVHEKHQVHRLSSIQEAVGMLSYCAGMKIKPTASLRIIPSDRKQRWQELELPRRTSIREKFSQSNRSASNALTSRSSKKIAGNETKRKMEY